MVYYKNVDHQKSGVKFLLLLILWTVYSPGVRSMAKAIDMTYGTKGPSRAQVSSTSSISTVDKALATPYVCQYLLKAAPLNSYHSVTDL